MALKNVAIQTSATTIHTAVQETAVLCIIFCNTTSSAKILSVYAYPVGGSAVAGTTILSDLTIEAHDTFIWSGDEKFILELDDVISAIADVTGVTVTFNYKEI